jgi:hypothetical protein
LVSWLLDVFVAIEEFFGLNLAMPGKGADYGGVALRQKNVLSALSASFGQLVAETVLAAVFRCLPCVILPMLRRLRPATGLLRAGPEAGG